MDKCIDHIPPSLRPLYPHLVKLAHLYQIVMKESDGFWRYYIDFVLSVNSGKVVAIDRPVYKLLKPYDRTPLSSEERYLFSMWVSLYKTLYSEFRLNIYDELGYKLFLYIGRYAFWLLYDKIQKRQILSKEDILEAIDTSLFINLITGYTCLLPDTPILRRDLLTKLIKNICWDFARGQVSDKSLKQFLENSPYFWVNKDRIVPWRRRALMDKVISLGKMYKGEYTDVNLFSHGNRTLEQLLAYHSGTSDITGKILDLETSVYTFLYDVNPAVAREFDEYNTD